MSLPVKSNHKLNGKKKMIFIVLLLIFPIGGVRATIAVYDMRCKDHKAYQESPSEVFHVVNVVQCGMMCRNTTHCNGFSYHKSSCRTLNLKNYVSITKETGSNVWCQDIYCPSGPCVSPEP